MRKAFVLLSGGLDSTTCLYKAIYDYAPEEQQRVFGRTLGRTVESNGGDIPWVEAVSIDYGQRHLKEAEYAKQTCDRLGITHTVLSVGSLLADKNTMLTQTDISIPDVSYSDLPHGVSPTYVPFRNGLMLSVLTAHAQKWINAENKTYELELDALLRHGNDVMTTEEALSYKMPSAGIYFGAHAEDAQNWAYPDCTPEFIGAMANAIFIGSYQQIRLHTPLMSLMKSEIVELGEKLGVPFENTWSCYKGEELHCGTCPTCRSRKQAFVDAGIPDPTHYPCD